MNKGLAGKQRGGFVLGLIIGLLLGLAVALGVALYITKVPIPFINKVPQRTAEQDLEEALHNKNWNPNAALAGKAGKAASGAVGVAASSPEPVEPAPAPATALKPVEKQAEKPVEKPADKKPENRAAAASSASAMAAAFSSAFTVTCNCSASSRMCFAFCDAAACSSAICSCCNEVGFSAASARFLVNAGTATEMMVPTCGNTAFNAGISHAGMGRSCFCCALRLLMLSSAA
jgi:hypothetical protein